MITVKAKTNVRFKFRSGRLLNTRPLDLIDLNPREVAELGSLFNQFFVASENRVELFDDEPEVLYQLWKRDRELV